MNRTTSNKLYSLDKKSYGYFIVYAIENFPEIHKKVKARMEELEEYTNPLPMVKYLIRKALVLGEQRVSLPTLAKGTDKYQSVKFEKFSGQFSYDKDQGGFVPMFVDAEMTNWLKSVHEKHEKRFINNAWNKAKIYLTSPGGKDPILIHEVE